MAREEKNKLKRLSRLLNWLMSSPHLKFSTLDSSPASHVLRCKRAFQGSAPWTAHRGFCAMPPAGLMPGRCPWCRKPRQAGKEAALAQCRGGSCFVCLLNIQLAVTLTEDVSHVFSFILSMYMLYMLSFHLFSV